MLHQQNMVTGRYKIRHVRFRAIRIESTLLVYELLDEPAVCKNGCGAGAEFERVDAAILMGPLSELEVGAFLGDLVEVS
jgi:hypothetical protein